MNYNLFKLIHITAIAIWLGPSAGGYFMIIVSRLNKEPNMEMWLRKEYLGLIYVETASFLILVLTGIGMIYSTRWMILKERWLRIKLSIVLVAILPVVFLQFYIYEAIVKKAFISRIGIEEAISVYDGFSKVALIILFIAVPAAAALAVFKPSLGRKAVD